MVENRQAVIVTGAASGMGRATAELLSRNGWAVLATDRAAEGLATLELNEWSLTEVADVASESDNKKLVDLALERFGRLDGLALVAGVAVGAPVEALDRDSVDQHLRVNFFGPLFTIQRALPHLRKSPNPSVVVVASTNGLGGDNSMTAYSASKFAAVGMVRSLAREIGHEGVRVNAVCPGATRTGMTIPIETAAPDRYRQIAESVPMQRWADPIEIATVIEFLLSPGASYVNGAAIPVDGGASAGVGLHPPARSANDLQNFEYRVTTPAS